MNRRLLLSIASLAASTALVAGATFAFFTDESTSEDNSFLAGSLDIDLDEDIFGSLPFSVSDMAPGSRATECASVNNIGTLDFNWQLTINQTDSPIPNLNDVLNMKIQTWTGGGSPSADDCDDDDSDTDWALVYDGLVSEFINPDTMGLLEDGGTVYVRFTGYLPDDLVTSGGPVDDDNYQGASATYDFVAEAFQTNDPAYGT